ncbi:hypothetical protein ACFLY4_09755 [Chloroflexota bacterium]
MTQNNRRNIYDKKDSLELGDKSESHFKNIAKKRGWQCSDANRDENINEHWDYQIQSNERIYRVDVKAMKRISRRDTSTQDEWIWIELHGVRENDEGWLYAGKADLLAFETMNSFVIVERERLIALIEEKVDKTHSVNKGYQAKYKVYSRSGRPDLITLVNISDLRDILWDEWIK